MAELPRMVMALKGSTTLRAARRAFSKGVSGFTSGPLRKRSNQLITGIGVHGEAPADASCWAFGLAGVLPWFEALSAGGLAARAAWQGVDVLVGAGAGVCG